MLQANHSLFNLMDSSSGKSSIKLEVQFSEKISRLFIFRFLWAYILWIPIIPLAIWVCIITFVHFWYMLILGKRSKSMWDTSVRFLTWMTQWQSYLGNHTDMRPGLWW